MRSDERPCKEDQAELLVRDYQSRMGSQGPGKAGKENGVFNEMCGRNVEGRQCKNRVRVSVTLDGAGRIRSVAKEPYGVCEERRQIKV